MKKLLIDAISTSSGGAISHLRSILKNFSKQNYFDEVDVYLPHKTKKKMPNIKNVNYISPIFFTKNLFLRIIWQIFFLNLIVILRSYKCTFVTGSSHFLLSKPIVTISQNLLPFTKTEVKKYFFTSFYIKLKFLYLTQSLSLKLSDGVIFLHRYSKNFILKRIGKLKGESKVVPHGLNVNLKRHKYKHNKYRLIYVSNIDYYKNQIFLLKALDDFLNKNRKWVDKLKIEFYGSAFKPALKEFNRCLRYEIKNKKNFKYLGLKNFNYIYGSKKNFDTIFLFASTCENFSVSLIEGMSRGYSILCVNRQPMKSVLSKSALFYEHNSILNFQNKLKKIISSKKTQNYLSRTVFKRSKNFRDKSVASETYKFLIKISKKYEK